MKFEIRMGGVFAQSEVEKLSAGGKVARHLSQTGTWYMLTNVYTHPWIRGKGYGHRVVAMATDWADRQGIDLYLYITAFEKGARIRSPKLRAEREEQLRLLYKRHSFVAHYDGMIRKWRPNANK